MNKRGSGRLGNAVRAAKNKLSGVGLGLFSECTQDYDKKYKENIVSSLSKLDHIQDDFINRAQQIMKTDFPMGNPLDYGTYYRALDIAYETYNFLQVFLYLPLSSLDNASIGSSSGCMKKISSLAYAHNMFDKFNESEDAELINMNKVQSQDFFDALKFFRDPKYKYKKMVDIFDIGSGNSGKKPRSIDDIKIIMYAFKDQLQEDYKNITQFFSTFMDSYTTSLEVTLNVLTNHKNEMDSLPDDVILTMLTDQGAFQDNKAKSVSPESAAVAAIAVAALNV